MSSGSYFPLAVKAVAIPKKSGGETTLGLPTVSDRIAQAMVKLVVEQQVNRMFTRTPTVTNRENQRIRPPRLPASVVGGTIGCWSSTSRGFPTMLFCIEASRKRWQVYSLPAMILLRHCRSTVFVSVWMIAAVLWTT